MNDNKFACLTKKIVTVSERGTIEDGVIIINNGKIEDIGTYNELKDKLKDISIYDYKDKVITPSLIDCHCHLLEYAPGSLYPVTKQTYLEAGKVLLFNALLSGITALGEQICGSPICNISIEEYMKVKDEVPLKIKFSLNSITIGTSDLSNYTCLNGNEQVDKNMLSNIDIVSEMAMKNEYPGENIFINATPANLPISEVPRAGEIMFTQDELKCIVDVFHKNGKKIGVHVAGKEGIDLALECGVDVLHHAHDIAEYLNLDENKLYGSEMLMFIAKPSMELLFENGFDENECLALLTYNPAKILGLENSIGKLDIGMSADFLVTDGIPGLEITKIEQILCVFVNGQKLIER